jgi:KDO2-lipid IV(A) lauroyltransferase
VPASGGRAARIKHMTQQLADAFADAIAEHPQDWHMLQRIWVDDLDPRRLAASAVTV